MKNLKSALQVAAGLAMSSVAMSQPTTPISTPQQAAGAFATVVATDRDALWATQLMSWYARSYARTIRETANPANSSPLSGSISVACPEGGSVVITGHVGLFYSLTADYQACKSHDGFEYVRTGRVKAKFAKLFSSVTLYKLVDVQFGDAAEGFIESRQFLPPMSAELDPTLSTLKYRIAGDLLDGDPDAQSVGDFFYTLSGTFEEQFSSYSGQSVIVQYFQLNSQDMVVTGGFEQQDGADLLSIERTQFVSGKMSLTSSVDTPPVPNEESFYWDFDHFTSTRAYRHNTGEYLRSFSGAIGVTLPASFTSPAGCRNGRFRIHTPQAIEETNNGSNEFTDGLVLLNESGQIRFDASDPFITIKVSGETVETHGYEGLIATGNCYL